MINTALSSALFCTRKAPRLHDMMTFCCHWPDEDLETSVPPALVCSSLALSSTLGVSVLVSLTVCVCVCLCVCVCVWLGVRVSEQLRVCVGGWVQICVSAFGYLLVVPAHSLGPCASCSAHVPHPQHALGPLTRTSTPTIMQMESQQFMAWKMRKRSAWTWAQRFALQ